MDCIRNTVCHRNHSEHHLSLSRVRIVISQHEKDKLEVENARVELLLDYILKIDFRNVGWMVISYVVLFFAGTGGMLGVAANAGRGWTILAVILFLVMAALAFIQRAVTGM